MKTQGIKLPLAIYLDEKDTKFIGDKKSTIYKMVIETIKWFKDNTGMEVSVICTKPNGDLYKVKI